MRISLREQEISHHGVKGMKWGVRKATRGTSEAKGEGGVTHPDRAKANASAETAKKHGTAALSNEDLRKLNDRLNLEQQFSRLTSKQKHGGQKFAEDLLREQGKQQLGKVIAKKVAKTAAVAAIL